MSDRIRTLDEFEEEYRRGLGKPLRPRPWRTVTTEWLQRFADGVGDYNPLWRDPAYAARGRYHDLVAPPSFLFSINFGANASMWGHIEPARVPMNSLTILYGGATIEWHAPIWLGDRVRAIETPVGVERAKFRQIGDALVCTGRTDYYNHRAEKVATLTNRMLRFANRGTGVESGIRSRHSQVAPDPLVWTRERRGEVPLWADGVHVGQRLPRLDKGTYTRTELYIFTYGALGTKRARKVDSGTIDVGAGGRADPEYARKSRAQAGSFDYGPQRICWMTQIVTDWMGDHGDLRSIDVRLRRPNLVGDTNHVTGEVVGTYVDDAGGHLAEIKIEVVNQNEVATATGTAVVRLPRRGDPLGDDILFSPEADPGHGLYG
ncbi:acyl dehydratase [Thermocatellispora tengchongensis]|uniref:Acyl dehydratase n=2 Tax=Thermocatellispora tengchongensis TaxID=1073253 RepID=A0A840PB15_9ACTN|nr:MaoC family dehydratase N-terminal domain-containing protein [Thermocatellispora tengchongensis]MBB5136838.1 acyl dehydratase [Thermocatellispora tengchongensis]